MDSSTYHWTRSGVDGSKLRYTKIRDVRNGITNVGMSRYTIDDKECNVVLPSFNLGDGRVSVPSPKFILTLYDRWLEDALLVDTGYKIYVGETNPMYEIRIETGHYLFQSHDRQSLCLEKMEKAGYHLLAVEDGTSPYDFLYAKEHVVCYGIRSHPDRIVSGKDPLWQTLYSLDVSVMTLGGEFLMVRNRKGEYCWISDAIKNHGIGMYRNALGNMRMGNSLDIVPFPAFALQCAESKLALSKLVIPHDPCTSGTTLKDIPGYKQSLNATGRCNRYISFGRSNAILAITLVDSTTFEVCRIIESQNVLIPTRVKHEDETDAPWYMRLPEILEAAWQRFKKGIEDYTFFILRSIESLVLDLNYGYILIFMAFYIPAFKLAGVVPGLTFGAISVAISVLYTR